MQVKRRIQCNTVPDSVTIPLSPHPSNHAIVRSNSLSTGLSVAQAEHRASMNGLLLEKLAELGAQFREIAEERDRLKVRGMQGMPIQGMPLCTRVRHVKECPHPFLPKWDSDPSSAPKSWMAHFFHPPKLGFEQFSFIFLAANFPTLSFDIYFVWGRYGFKGECLEPEPKHETRCGGWWVHYHYIYLPFRAMLHFRSQILFDTVAPFLSMTNMNLLLRQDTFPWNTGESNCKRAATIAASIDQTAKGGTSANLSKEYLLPF